MASKPADKAQALRFNAGKPEMHYFMFLYPFCAEALGWVQARGADKYGYGNWTLGGKPDREYLDAFGRHMAAWTNGVDYDEDTGSLHLAQALWNLMNLIERNYSDMPVSDPDFDLEAFIERWKDAPKNDIDPRTKEQLS